MNINIFYHSDSQRIFQAHWWSLRELSKSLRCPGGPLHHQWKIRLYFIDLSCLCVLSHSSVSSDFATPWTLQLPLGFSVHRIFQARILQWVAISSSRGSSQLKDWTHVSSVSCIAGRFFSHWAIREANLIFNYN